MNWYEYFQMLQQQQQWPGAGYSNPAAAGQYPVQQGGWQNSPAPTTNMTGPNPMGMPTFNLPNWMQQPTNPGFNWGQLQAMPENDRVLAMQYYNTALPWVNSAAEIQQSQRDFIENARRYDQEYQRTGQDNQWAQGHAENQLGLQNRTQDELTGWRNRSLDQQESEFMRRLGLDDRTQTELTAWRNRGLDQQESEFGRRFGLDTRTQDDLVKYREMQNETERRGQDIGLQQSAINTWGRREKPNARWM